MSKKVLDEILAKSAGTLNEYEVSILRARQSYLSSADAEKFAAELKVEGEVVNYSKMNKADLIAVCAEKGIAVEATATKADILALIEEEAVPETE